MLVPNMRRGVLGKNDDRRFHIAWEHHDAIAQRNHSRLVNESGTTLAAELHQGSIVGQRYVQHALIVRGVGVDLIGSIAPISRRCS